MTFRVEIAALAERDVHDAYQHIERDSPGRAVRWLQGLLEAVYELDSLPHRFARHECWSPTRDIRRFRYHSHQVIFEVNDSSGLVRILRVWHMSRQDPESQDLPPELGPPSDSVE